MTRDVYVEISIVNIGYRLTHVCPKIATCFHNYVFTTALYYKPHYTPLMLVVMFHAQESQDETQGQSTGTSTELNGNVSSFS